jgi:hypothetical protein
VNYSNKRTFIFPSFKTPPKVKREKGKNNKDKTLGHVNEKLDTS